MTVRDIVAEYLRENGYDGLCGDECGCFMDDIMPCHQDGYWEGVGDCPPGHLCEGEDGPEIREGKG